MPVAITVELQIDYIRALIERLRATPIDKEAGLLCTRVEANLDALVELLTDAPAPDPAILEAIAELEAEDLEEPPAERDVAAADPEPVSEPAPEYASSIPDDVVEPPTTPLTVAALAANGHVPLTPRQTTVIDALREAKGNQTRAAEILHRTLGAVSGTVSHLKASGRLPRDVADLLATREHVRRPTISTITPAMAATYAREADTARDIAARSREREAEASTAHDDFVATRENRARAKANADMQQRRGHA